MTSIEKESPKNPYIISTGVWDENISWEFIVTKELPDLNLCTAVCCIVTFDSKFLIVKNKRGWELPAGHIETGETLTQAIQREVLEETNAKIYEPVFFGYKRLTTKERVAKQGQDNTFYPFPYSYLVFYFAEAKEILAQPLAQDIEEVGLVTYSQAKELLDTEGKYKNVFEYLIKNQMVTL